LLPWVVYENIVFDFSGPSLKIGNPLIVEEDEWDAKG